MLLATVTLTFFAATELIAGDLEQIGEGYTFTEGPVWVAGEGLLFSDVRTGIIHKVDGSVFRDPSHHANGLFLDNEGRLIACESELKRVTRTEADGSITVIADSYDGKTLNSTNDVCVRSDGMIYFTDPGRKKNGPDTTLKFNGVYSVDPKTKKIELLSDVAAYPNGIGLSPDEKTLYVADTMGKVCRAYDVAADGSVSNERDFCEALTADGLAVDSEGNVWVAVKDGVAAFDPTGKRVAHVKTPMMPTNCAFGGADGKTLYITARKLLFKIQTNVKGQGTF